MDRPSHRGPYGPRTSVTPWGLTLREALVLDTVCKHGCYKLAADKMGISPNTLRTYITRSKKKLGVRFSLQLMLKWDQWRRDNQLAETPSEICAKN